MAAKRVACPACGGKGTQPLATDEVACASCDGRGTVTAKRADKIAAQLAKDLHGQDPE